MRTHETSPRTPEASPSQESQPELSREDHRKLGDTVLAAAESSGTDPSQTTQSNTHQESDRPLTPEEEEQAYAEQVLADITRWRKQYDQDECDYIRYTERVRPQTAEEKQRARERLLRAEHDAEFSWRQMQASTREALSEHIIPSDHYAIARAEKYGDGIDPGATIEAASAQLYDERIQPLHEAIKNDPSLTQKERDAQINHLRQTWSVVYAYIEATDDLYRDHSGQIRRNQRHNDMIRHLNKINDLARAHDTAPLTFRNFMPNDVTFGYHQSLDKDGALWHKAEYDREIVANYFRKVFSKEISREESARAARARYMR